MLRVYHSKVEVEVKIGTTTIDVLYVDESHPLFPRKIAIESKDWSSSLTSGDLAEIYRLYLPALASKKIDNLWIISNHPLMGQPRTSIDDMDGVAYTTFEQFQSSLINFNPVIQYNISSFERDDSFNNFIDTRKRGSDTSMMKVIENWLKGDASGLVVYGGYGLGKTTFSKHLASKYSHDHAVDSSVRIPIRFSLGEIFHKQDIGALVSSALAGADHNFQLKNFSFDAFMEMNRRGRFILIFDGFDEMRHAIDVEDFVYNFEQIRKFMEGDAKVVILGRPDAFLSNAEELKVLSSLFDNPKSVTDHLELVEVAFFNEEEVNTYISGFLKKRGFRDDETEKVDRLVRVAKIDGDENILSRPVQLKMFTQVIDEFIEEDRALNRFDLYDAFIYRFIVRERAKPARVVDRGDDLPARDPRARFMQNVAWWILTKKKENRFTAEELTRDLVPSEIAGKHDAASALREALVGSVMEPMDHSGVLGKKGRRNYYFPHKSYIEFLVAQYFSYARFSIDMYRSFIENITPEIISFVSEGPPAGITNLRDGLEHATSRIPLYVIESAARDIRLPNEIRSRNVEKSSPINIYTYYAYLRANKLGVSEFLRQQLSASGTDTRFLTLANCIGDYLKESGEVALARVLIVNLLTSVFDEHKIREYGRDFRPVEIFRDDEVAAKAGAILGAMEMSGAGIVLYPDRLMDLALSSAGPAPIVELPARGDHRVIKISRKSLLSGTKPTSHPDVVISTLLARAVEQKSDSFPIVLKGGAERRYSLRSV